MNSAAQRHRLQWLLEDGRYSPKLTCLHKDVPAEQHCDGDTFTEEPESLVCDDDAGREIRDGIILSHWQGTSPWLGEGDDGAELHWRYEDEPVPVDLQRHIVRFLLAEPGGFDLVEPAFECLHGPVEQCHAQAWREDLTLFPEWHAGPDTPLRAGAIGSWWPDGPSDHSLPGWDYEDPCTEALPAPRSGARR